MTDPPIAHSFASLEALDIQIRELTVMVHDLHRLMKEQIEVTEELVSLVEEATIIRVEPVSNQSPLLS